MPLFGDNEGKITALSETGVPAVLAIAGLTGMTQVLVTSMGFGQGANVQFMETLRDAIYVYSFGEKMGTVKVGGIILFRSCTGGVNQGIPQVMRYYKQNSVSLNNRPVQIAITQEVVKGFLVGINISDSDPRVGMAQFGLAFASLPLGSGRSAVSSGVLETDPTITDIADTGNIGSFS